MYIEKLGWSIDASTSVVTVPPNLDNNPQSAVVQESIQLPRKSPRTLLAYAIRRTLSTELTKIITHATATA